MKENKDYIVDKTMLDDIAAGNEVVFGKFVHQLYQRLFPYTITLVRSEMEADDVLQEAFLKIWLHRSSLSNVENPAGWVYTIIANTAANHLRSRIRHELKVKKFNMQAVVSEEIVGEIDAKFTQTLIDEAVNQLPEKRKLVFLLSKKEGLSRKEIAKQLNISENTVRNQLSEAIHSVHQHLQRKNDSVFSFLVITQCLVENIFRHQ